MPILTNLGGFATPTFMLKPPQEQLLEKVCYVFFYSFCIFLIYFCMIQIQVENIIKHLDFFCSIFILITCPQQRR